MNLEALQLNDFRNLSNIQLRLQPQLNFLVGDNGQGKTNILEAVHLLCRGSSFRSTQRGDFIRQQSTSRSARVRGRFWERKGFDTVVELRLEVGKRVALINEKKCTFSGLVRNCPTVLFSPESLAAIKEGPEQRRRLIDDVLVGSYPHCADLIEKYSRTVRSRNRILRLLSEGDPYHRELLDTLESLNASHLKASVELTMARMKALRDLLPFWQEAAASVLSAGSGDILVDYLVSGQSALDWSESRVIDSLNQRLRELRSSEISFGSSLVGPHKHDLKILFTGNDSRFYCSQGQQRALILALKIAQIVYHHKAHKVYPLLLLDDVMSELDPKRRVNLMKFLERVSAQILITATDLSLSDLFGADRHSVFIVRDGQVNSPRGD